MNTGMPIPPRALWDGSMATRRADWIDHFCKALEHDPAALKRTWQSIREIMAPCRLDLSTKAMMWLALSATNQSAHCIAPHAEAARKAGMSEKMFSEWMAVVGMAHETSRLAGGYQVGIDGQFKT